MATATSKYQFPIEPLLLAAGAKTRYSLVFDILVDEDPETIRKRIYRQLKKGGLTREFATQLGLAINLDPVVIWRNWLD